jgi:ABC-type phosphate transport system permease subunit
MHAHIASVITAVPADGWDDIRKFLPGAPNLSPFMSLASIVSALLALILGFILIYSIVMGGFSFAKFVTAGGSPQKSTAAKDGMKKYGAIILIVGVLWGTAIAFIIKAGQSVT